MPEGPGCSRVEAGYVATDADHFGDDTDSGGVTARVNRDE